MASIMKYPLSVILSFLLCFSSAPSYARDCENIEDHAENTEALYRKGCGAIDGAYTATSSSMLGWGIALFIAIGVITAVLHQSKGRSISSGGTTSDTTSGTTS